MNRLQSHKSLLSINRLNSLIFNSHSGHIESVLILADGWKLCLSEIKCYLVWGVLRRGGDSGAERHVKVQHLRPSCFLNLQSQAGSRINEWCSVMFSSKQATKLAGSLQFCADVSRIQIIRFLGIMTIGGTVLPWEQRRERQLLNPVLN